MGHIQRNFAPSSYAIERGNQRLPEAMAGALRSQVRRGSPVAAVANAAQTLGYSYGYQIQCIPRSRFWRADGLPLTMWIDGPADRPRGAQRGADPLFQELC